MDVGLSDLPKRCPSQGYAWYLYVALASIGSRIELENPEVVTVLS